MPIGTAYLREKISIHALRGEGDVELRKQGLTYTISIHALRGEGDNLKTQIAIAYILFQSTPSVGRATKINKRDDYTKSISIHALRGEGDSYWMK